MYPKNLTVIKTTTPHDIISELAHLGVKGAHFTNGTFAYDAKMIVPTALAGFKRVMKIQSHLPLIIAVNSDESMRLIGKEVAEQQLERAEKVAIPIAQLFENNRVIVVYYDETTPNRLYEALSKKGLTRTLHKWGYGTSIEEPKIEGAECFEIVYAFPLPNDTKPVCYYDTEIAQIAQNILVEDLRNQLISNEGVLFDLPEGLKCYQANSPEKKLSYLGH